MEKLKIKIKFAKDEVMFLFMMLKRIQELSQEMVIDDFEHNLHAAILEEIYIEKYDRKYSRLKKRTFNMSKPQYLVLEKTLQDIPIHSMEMEANNIRNGILNKFNLLNLA